jgi:hypothetical protein
MRSLLLLPFVIVASLYAQPPTEIYKKWSNDNPNVRPYLFFNQSKYTPGDTVRFKAYMFERGSIMKGSFILSLSVVNKHEQLVAQTDFRVNNGIAYNQVILPDTLNSGLYRFITHNAWMRGNPGSPPVWTDLPVVKEYTLEPEPPIVSDAKFFPEGGKLINGIPGHVIVKLDGNYDSCKLMSSQGNVVTKVKIRDGLGSMHFTPESGKDYVLLVGPNSYSLPTAVDDGIGILLTRGASRQSVRVLIAAPPESVHRKKPVYLLITINGVAYFSQEMSFGDLEFMQFGVSLASLPAGVATLTVIGDERQIVAERHFIVDYQAPVKVDIQPMNKTVRSRERVDVEVGLTDQNGHPVEGEFAVSVVNQKLFPTEAAPAFADDLLTPVNTNIKPNREMRDWQERLDQQVLTFAQDSSLWREVFANQPVDRPTGRHTSFKFSAIDRATGNPLPDMTKVLVHLQGNTNGYEGVVKNGILDLTMPGDFWEIDEFYFLAETPTGYHGNLGIKLLEESHRFAAAPVTKHTNQREVYADFVSKIRLINKSYGFFTSKAASEPIHVNTNFAIEDEFNGVDIDVDLGKFISFPNMDEVLREVIPAVSHRTAGKKSIVRVDLLYTELIPRADPLYIIDGLMTLSTDYFINLDPDNVMRIKVVNDMRKLDRIGRLGRNGVVIVQTVKPNPAAVKATGAYVSLQGISRPLPFVSTTHSKDDRSDIPDFRAAHHWDPIVKTDKNGKATVSFFASDDVGAVAIKILGTTVSGAPFSGQALVDVVYDDQKN